MSFFISVFCFIVITAASIPSTEGQPWAKSNIRPHRKKLLKNCDIIDWTEMNYVKCPNDVRIEDKVIFKVWHIFEYIILLHIPSFFQVPGHPHFLQRKICFFRVERGSGASQILNMNGIETSPLFSRRG